jgi:hypothetical protein
MNFSILITFSIFALLVFSSCTSNSLFLTGKPNGAYKAIGFSGISIKGHFTDSLGKKYIQNDGISILPIDAGIAVGFSENLDIYFRYTLPLSFNLGFKASNAFTENRNWYVGAGFQVGGYGWNDDDTTSTSTRNFNFNIPFYLSYFPVEVFGVTLIPEYKGVLTNESLGNKNGYHYESLLGGNANIKIGRKWGVILETSMLYNFQKQYPEFQAGLAAFFPIPVKVSTTSN